TGDTVSLNEMWRAKERASAGSAGGSPAMSAKSAKTSCRDHDSLRKTIYDETEIMRPEFLRAEPMLKTFGSRAKQSPRRI
ncbi:MAG: hypothetical protein M3430_14445, partial [Acidobacteriota bacterium]|nr:hypothetical protein [Acidobacteriota bacterium]